MYKSKNIQFTYKFLIVASLAVIVTSCRKFVTIDTPKHSLVEQTTFAKEQPATGALLHAYYYLNNLFANPNAVDNTKVSALYADEMFLSGTNTTLRMLYKNALDAQQDQMNTFWTEAYSGIHRVNSVIEGVAKYGAGIPEVSKKQLTGEAKFLRAFFHHMLTNLYGDVPVVLTTDYKENSKLTRSPVAEVYTQILKDLEEAYNEVGTEYLDGKNKPFSQRIRVNKDVVNALRARVYLYMENWSKAEELATTLISKSGTYSLESDPKNAFDITSTEPILQIDDQMFGIPQVAFVYTLSWMPPFSETNFAFGWLDDALLNKFEEGDSRKTAWTASYNTGTQDVLFSNKYYEAYPSPQFPTLIRLAEMYLIRAEARIQQNNIAGGIEDLNTIRQRARDNSGSVNDPLPDLSTALSKTDAMIALENERQTELFLEGHRWPDLKRWQGFNNPAITRAEEVMPAIAAAKGGTWNANKILLPIPQLEININGNLVQNPGY